jgi:esterase/lipase
MSQFRNFLTSLPVARELSVRHQPSTADDAFQYTARSIGDYLDQCRHKVETGRTDLEDAQRDWIIQGNSPFLLRPENEQGPARAILMTHGLTDSPYQMRDIGKFFQKQGFHVLAMQLPGHGTRPGDLLAFHWQDWLRAHQHLLDLLSEEVEQVYLLGFSAGATLSIYQALRHDHIRGLFLFSPAIRVRRLARLAYPLSRLGRRWKRFAWFDVQPDSDSFKYESLTTHSISEVYDMIQALNRLATLTELRVPVFVAASDNDITINTRVLLEWFEKLGELPRRMLYYSARDLYAPHGVRVVPGHLPDLNIKSFAHTALLHAPSDPHYGADGAYRFCTRYYHLDPSKYERCKDGQEDCLGEMFEETANCQVIRRLTYNPLFEEMLDEIRVFLNQLDEQPS